MIGIDKFTGLTNCELRKIERQVKDECASNLYPEEVRILDSTITALQARKHAMLLHYKYECVSRVCFRNELSVSNRIVNDTFFTCVTNGGY